MAVRFNGAESLSRTASLPAIDLWTMMAWIKVSTDRDAFSCFLAFEAGTPTGRYYYLGTQNTGTNVVAYNSSGFTSVATMNAAEWHHVAFEAYAPDNTLYAFFDGGFFGSISLNPVIAAGNLRFGATNDGLYFNGCMAALKIYDEGLLESEIAAEMACYRPIRTANLNSFYPLKSAAEAATDYSGNGLTLTVNGTLATEDGPPIPWPRVQLEGAL